MSDARRRLLLATGNPGKIREFRQVLGDLPVEILTLDDFDPIDEPVEDGRTFAENARKKALFYARQTGCWAMADDSGLVVDALGGEPGVLSARYAGDEVAATDRAAVDQANNRKLLRRLQGVADEKRTARFVCHLALADEHQVLLEATGSVEGVIGHEPHGDNGFGYDPLFFVPSEGCTTAQLPPGRKNAISHRGQAARVFAQGLDDLLDR